MSSKKKVLITGFGSIGRKHARIINKIWPSFEISTCSKLRNGNYPEIKLIKNNFESFKDSLIWKPDYVIIATPCNFHIEQALFFAKHDIPVFIEKPLGHVNERNECYST